jgi:hypothetical protein
MENDTNITILKLPELKKDEICITTTAGTVYTKINVFADSCVCNSCGYDFRLAIQDIKQYSFPTLLYPFLHESYHHYLPNGTMCPKCGTWNVYKEFTCVSC